MKSGFFTWKKTDWGFRPVATRNFYVKTCIKFILVEKGTVGGLFSPTSILEDCAWAEESVIVRDGSCIGAHCYVCGDVEISHTDVLGNAYINASGKILDSNITSNSSIEHASVKIVDSAMANSRIGPVLKKKLNCVANLSDSKIDDSHLIGNFFIQKTEISGDVVVYGDNESSTEIKNAIISGDGTISGPVHVFDSTIFLSGSNITDNVFVHNASARFIKSNIKKTTEITGNNISILDSDIFENARIGGNCFIENSVINSKEKLDFISTLPTNATVKLIDAEIRRNGDFTQFYLHDNKVVLVCRGKNIEMLIPTKDITSNSSEPACFIDPTVKAFVFKNASKDKSKVKEWARWVCDVASRLDLCEEAIKKYEKFRIATGLHANKKNFVVPLLLWSELSLASAILSVNNPGLGFSTKDEITEKALKLSNHVFFDIKEKHAFVNDAPIIVTFSALESLASEYDIDVRHLVDSLKEADCIFVDF